MARRKKKKPLKRAVIKEELVELTNGHLSALILNQLIYWSERVRDYDEMLEEEYKRLEIKDKKLKLSNGWIYKSHKELKDELMVDTSEATIGRRINKLVDNGWIHKRRNPRDKRDRTNQYRVDLIAIEKDLFKLGYTLDKYPILSEHVKKLHSESCKNHGAASKNHGDSSSTHSEDTKNHGDECNTHSDETLPETTTETTSKTTTDNNNSNRFSKSELKGIKSFYKEITERELKSNILNKITYITNNADNVIEAIDRASLNNATAGPPSANYILKIMENLENEDAGINPGEDKNIVDSLEAKGWS